MKKILFIITFVFFLFNNSFTFAQDNPFLSKNNYQKIEKTTNDVTTQNISIIVKFNRYQHQLNNEMARLTREVKEGKSKQSFFILILISFFYGAFHAIGPGHGKCLVCSYFVSEGSDIKKGLLLGNLVAIIHATSAIVIASTIYFIIKGSYSAFSDNLSRSLSLFSYSLIILLGIYLLIKNIFELRKKKIPIKHIHSEHCHDHNHEFQENKQKKSKNIFFVATAIGILPCPGAITILLFSISLNYLQLGIILAAFIALGMGLTISLTGMLTIFSRNKTLSFISKQNCNYSSSIKS